MKRTIHRGLALLLALPLALAACSGFLVEGQHDACVSVGDCPTGDGLECLFVVGSTESYCELRCDPNDPPETACPKSQVCLPTSSFGVAVCKETEAT